MNPEHGNGGNHKRKQGNAAPGYQPHQEWKSRKACDPARFMHFFKSSGACLTKAPLPLLKIPEYGDVFFF